MTSPDPTVVVLPDADLLAASVAARIVTALLDAQAARGRAHLVLTGGTIGTASLQALRDSPARSAVDWRAVDLWWGDERWVPADSSDRNDVQAEQALLSALDLDPARVHRIAAPGSPSGDGAREDDDPEAAAERYAAELAAAAPTGSDVPAFDVLLLGMGPEGHTASIFPESPAAHDERTVVAVHGCPKPPPTRVSLGFSAITAAREVWVVASGAEKAPMVALALSGAGRVQVPVAGARGRVQTLFLLDEAAASSLPRDLRRR